MVNVTATASRRAASSGMYTVSRMYIYILVCIYMTYTYGRFAHANY